MKIKLLNYLIFPLLLFGLGGIEIQAQTLLNMPGHSRTYNGSVRGYWFEAPVDFRIVKLYIPQNAGTGDQHIQVMVAPTAPATFATTSPTAGLIKGYWRGITGTNFVTTNIVVKKGEFVWVLGQRGNANSYSAAVTPYSTTILGKSTSLGRCGYQGLISTSAAPNVWKETAGSISRVELYYAPLAPVNASISSIVPIDVCTPTQDIKAVVGNSGTEGLDSVDINWSINGVAQPVIKYNRPYVIGDTIGGGKNITVTLKTGFVFTPFNDYDLKVWTANPNGMQDTVNEDDTMYKDFQFLGSPGLPSANAVSNCGIGQVPMTGAPSSSGDSLIWFDKNSFNHFFGIGKSVMSPFLNVSDTLLLQSYRMLGIDTANSGLGGTTRFNAAIPEEGGMFSITAKNSDVVFTNFGTTVFNSTSTKYKVYIKDGSFAGFQTNPSAWTLIESGETMPYSIGVANDIIELPVNIVVPAGKTVSLYITLENNQPVFSTSDVIDNSEFVTTTGNVQQGLFGSTTNLTGYSLNHLFEYYGPLCSGSNAPVKVPVEIIKLAIGADLEKGSTFEGTYAGGTLTDPDIIAEGDEIVYNISNPTGFPNTSYGTTWEVAKTSVETIFGNPENMGNLVFTPPSGSADGTYSYTAHDDFTDSTLKVSVTITDLNTSCDTVIERYIFVAPRVKPGFSLPAALCQGAAISFINTSTISSGGIIYKWEFGDGDTSIAPNTAHRYLSPGNYDVRLITTSTPYGYVTDSILKITVNETPQADFSRTNACEGFNVELKNTTIYGGTGTVVYVWDFGDGSTHSSSKDESKLYASPNGYKVTLVADVAGCTSSKTKTVYQFSTPKVGFTAPSSSVCNHSEVNFVNQSTLLSGKMGAYWDYGNSVNSNKLNGQITYATANTFDVKLKMISEFGCTDSLTKQVVVSEGASAKFDYDLACIENPTNFTFSGDAPSSQTPLIVWTFANEGQGAGASASHKWQSVGTKTVKLKVSLNNGCDDSISQVIEVNDQPKVDFSYSGLCEDDAVTFQNNSSVGTGNVDYTWDFGDNTSSTKVSPKHSYTAGSYTVKLKAGLAGGCSDSLSKVVDVSANPICDFTVTEKYIWGHRGFDFTPTNTSYSFYRWTFGDGGKSSDASPEYQFLNDGDYSVRLFVRNAAGCECEKTIKHEVSGTVGINETNLQGVSVYPNPTTGKLTVELPEVGTSYTIKVMNVIGKTVQIGEYSNTTGAVELNIGDQANGIYLIKITSNKKSKSMKVNLLN